MRAALPDAVIFDNDGLLLDTESVWTRAEQDLFEAYGREFTPADKQELVGTSAPIAGAILERRLGEHG
jgi:beta-phosphoglucomutase-like phosphatase (HAD superfamily)